MARNKIEKEFSEKLSTRQINPSAAAWDRLDAMLATAETQRKPRRNYWFFVAATIVGIGLFASLFVIKSSDANAVDPYVSGVAETEAAVEKAQPDSAGAPVVKTAQVSPVDTAVPQSVHKPHQLQQPSQRKMLAAAQSQKLYVEPAQSENQSPGENPSAQKKSTTTATDIPESLLAAIKSRTEAQKTAVIKVNAHDLLQDVDKEPEPSQRQRFLKTVQNVKVALGNRNLEESH